MTPLLGRLKHSLAKTSRNLTDGLSALWRNEPPDPRVLQDLEDRLLMADFGLDQASALSAQLTRSLPKGITPALHLRELIAARLRPYAIPLTPPDNLPPQHPWVVVLCGVNGSGKTTTAAKLAHRYINSGMTVALAACDTFRAAAAEQLNVWSQRLNINLISAPNLQDPSAIAFDAWQQARERNINLLIVDTAGRLHNRNDLLQELQKICRTLAKHDPAAPHHCLLVLDATIGQSAREHLNAFNAAVPINGLIVTKLDSGAKGGILLPLCATHALPLHAVTIGEHIGDLIDFNADDFAEAIIPTNP